MKSTIVLVLILALALTACAEAAASPEPPEPEETAPPDLPDPTAAASPTPTATATTPPTATATATATPTTSVPVSQPGQDSGPVCQPRADWPVYTIIPGDTLGDIARRAATTTQALVEANCLADPNRIEVGQQIRVPVEPIRPTPAGSIGNDGTLVEVAPVVSVQDGITGVAAGQAVTLTWPVVPPNTAYIEFRASVDGVTQLLGVDRNPADGARIDWTVPPGFSGLVHAMGFDARGSWLSFSDYRPVNAVAPPAGEVLDPARCSRSQAGPFTVDAAPALLSDPGLGCLKLASGQPVTVGVEPPFMPILIEFWYLPRGGQPDVIGTIHGFDGSPLEITWQTPPGPFTGELYAFIYSDDASGMLQTDTLAVYGD